MKYLVISDNHGDAQILQTVAHHFKGQVDYMLHCGDSCLSADSPALVGYQTVLGNCDYENYAEKKLLEVEQDKILLTHGHLYDVNYGLNRLSLAAKQEQANLVFFGHTHCLGVEYVENCLYLNPGSISYPRGQYRALGGSLAIVETTPAKIKVQYYDRNFDAAKELAWEFAR